MNDRAVRQPSIEWVFAPVVLGCCPQQPRCILCNPSPAPPSAELIDALAHNYRSRAGTQQQVVVAFFGGPPPSDAQLAPVHGPFTIRVRPDLLDRARAAELVARGCIGIELDALTFDDAALREAGRRYRASRVVEMAVSLTDWGVRTGVVLAPGLPRTTHDTALHDARTAADLFATARLHPVLVLERSQLRELHASGDYTPLTVGQAVTTCHEMVEVLERGGVQVIRVGLQPGPDGAGRAIGGPKHSALRQLVESRRTLVKLREALALCAGRGDVVTVWCAPQDETRTRGPFNQHIRILRAEFELAEFAVSPDNELCRGEFRIERCVHE